MLDVQTMYGSKLFGGTAFLFLGASCTEALGVSVGDSSLKTLARSADTSAVSCCRRATLSMSKAKPEPLLSEDGAILVGAPVAVIASTTWEGRTAALWRSL